MIVKIFFIGYEIFSLQYYDTEFSLWDRFELTRNEKGEEFTLQEFLDYFQVSKQTMLSMQRMKYAGYIEKYQKGFGQ